MARSRRRRVFISYHHQEDQEYKDRFVRMMGDHIVDRSVSTGDIVDQDLPVDEIIPIYGDAAVFSPAGFLDSRFRGNDGRGSYDAYAFG